MVRPMSRSFILSARASSRLRRRCLAINGPGSCGPGSWMVEFMKRLSLSRGIGLAVATFTVAVAQPMPIYENFGIISGPPQIDALAFANYGTFNVGTILPFDFQNTLNFTNTGTMTGGAGFQFDTASSTGPRRMAASFVNRT